LPNIIIYDDDNLLVIQEWLWRTLTVQWLQICFHHMQLSSF